MKRKGENLGKITDYFPKMDTEAKKSKTLKPKEAGEEMSASSSKHEKYDSAVDETISDVRKSYFGKPIDDEFLIELSILMEKKEISAVRHITSLVEMSHFEKTVNEEFLSHLKFLMEDKNNKIIVAMDDIIYFIKKSHLGKPVDQLFLHDLKSLMAVKLFDAKLKYCNGDIIPVIKPATAPVKSVFNTELDCLPLPDEILVKIFGYLNIQDISRCARISRQLNRISKDSTLWQSWEKLSTWGYWGKQRKIPTEFLTYIIQRGITELYLFKCEILPPKVKLAELKQPLNLKSLILDETKGDKTLVNKLLTSYSMEKIDIRQCMMSKWDISQFINVLPQIGSQLKSLNLANPFPGKLCGLSSISSIVDSCLGLEELSIGGNSLNEDAIYYLCENLTSKILNLDIRIGGWLDRDKGLNDNNIRALVKRCPQLKVLDIRYNEKLTYQGLVSIIEGLHFLEYLGVPDSIANELGLPNMAALGRRSNIDLVKMGRLKSMKNIKAVLVADPDRTDECKSILKEEIPQLKNCDDGELFTKYDFEVAVTNTEDFRRVEFCPNCHECDKYMVLKC